MKTTPIRRFCCGAVLIAALLPMQLVAQDSVTLDRRTRRGSKLIGEITKVSRTTVSISTSGSDREIPVNEIQRIGVSGEPSDLRQARTAVLSGQYEQAAEALEQVELPASARSLLRQEVDYYRATANAQLALQGSGDLKAAEDGLMSFLRRERDTWHFFAAVETLGDVASAAGRYEAAAKYYGQIGRAPWPEYQLKSHVLMGRSLQSQGQWKQAMEKFDDAISATASDPLSMRQQTLARVRRAACAAQLGETDAAAKVIEDVLAENDADDAELFAEAYLALGTAHRQSQQTVDAVLAYLHVDLLFYQQRDAHAEALYYLAELWPEIEQPARGIQARQLLQNRYPGSVWAKRAN